MGPGCTSRTWSGGAKRFVFENEDRPQFLDCSFNRFLVSRWRLREFSVQTGPNPTSPEHLAFPFVRLEGNQTLPGDRGKDQLP